MQHIARIAAGQDAPCFQVCRHTPWIGSHIPLPGIIEGAMQLIHDQCYPSPSIANAMP